jgi:predicted ATPase/DNA-binding winged helix-turn-helix (wHTH) protein
LIEFSGFSLDIVNQCLWRHRDNGEVRRILVAPKNYAVLRYLAEHPGRLVTEEELLTAVWPRTYVQQEAVKRQVYEIRKILEDDPRAPRFIETLPRRGYRFIAPIRAGSGATVGAPAASVHGPLVGRDRPLAALRDHARAASNGRRQIVFICGEAGIGKTALVDELQRQLAAEVPALRVAPGQCIEGYGGMEPYYPILEALGQLCLGCGSDPIVETLATHAPTWLVQLPALLKREHRAMLQHEIHGATRERMVREIGAALEAIAAEIPLLLILEDIQWVDHSTLDVLSALARRRAPAKLMLIATKRPLELRSSEHPLKALKQDLLVRQLCHELELEPLTESDVAEYLAPASLQQTPPDGLVKVLHRHSGGNPLFMVTALDHLKQRGLIARNDGGWQFRDPLDKIELGVPESLRQMIEAQISRLSVEEQRMLGVASVAGAVFSANVIAGASDTDPEDVEDLCERVVRSHRILRPAGCQQFPDGSVGRRYEFVHALYRETLYHLLTPRRRQKLHQRIGDRLNTLFSRKVGEVASELAHHFERGTDSPQAIKYRPLAAQAAERRYGQPEAAASAPSHEHSRQPISC